jgi:hypothetical protein
MSPLFQGFWCRGPIAAREETGLAITKSLDIEGPGANRLTVSVMVWPRRLGAKLMVSPLWAAAISPHSEPSPRAPVSRTLITISVLGTCGLPGLRGGERPDAKACPSPRDGCAREAPLSASLLAAICGEGIAGTEYVEPRQSKAGCSGTNQLKQRSKHPPCLIKNANPDRSFRSVGVIAHL